MPQKQPASSALPAAIGKTARVEGTALNETSLRLPLADPHIIVKKSERRLMLFDGDKQVREYRIGLGFTPVGDKTHQLSHRDVTSRTTRDVTEESDQALLNTRIAKSLSV